MESLVPNHSESHSLTSSCSTCSEKEKKNPLQAIGPERTKDVAKQCSFNWYDSDDDDSDDELPTYFDVDSSGLESDPSWPENDDENDCDDAWVHIHSVNRSWSSIHKSPSYRSSKRQCKIKFSNVEIREYALTIGDHPFCEEGVPLSLDWKHSPDMNVVDVDTFMERKKRESVGEDDCPEQLCYYQYLPEPPKRLSPDERKERLIAVSDFSEEQLENAAARRTTESEQVWGLPCQFTSTNHEKETIRQETKECHF